jgi:hypothetical protein
MSVNQQNHKFDRIEILLLPKTPTRRCYTKEISQQYRMLGTSHISELIIRNHLNLMIYLGDI